MYFFSYPAVTTGRPAKVAPKPVALDALVTVTELYGPVSGRLVIGLVPVTVSGPKIFVLTGNGVNGGVEPQLPKPVGALPRN